MLQTAQRTERVVAVLMLLEAASLAVMSAVHLPNDAGVAEAIICLVLVAGATALIRRTSRAQIAAGLSVGFAILGFLVGLRFTTQTGGVDLAYHLVVLPVLVLTELMLLAPRRRHGRPPRQPLPRRQP